MSPWPRWTWPLVPFAGLCLFGHLSGWVRPDMVEPRQLWAALGLVALALLALGLRTCSLTRVAAALALAGLVASAELDPARLAFAGGWLLLVPACAGGGGALALAAVLGFAAQLAPWLASPLTLLADAACRAVDGGGSVAGPTALLLRPLLLALAAVLLGAGRARRPGRAALGALALLGIALWHLRAVLGSAGAPALPDVLARVALASTLLAAAAALACSACWPRSAHPAPARSGWRLCLAGAACGVLASLGLLAPGQRPSTIAFLNEGGLDWEVPRFGEYDDDGMFGLLPKYLHADGFACRALEASEIGDSQLAGVDVLVLINCPKRWTPPERAAVRRHMERGGSVLVLGDHTDVFGLQRGLNTLLEEHGIRFEYDSAYHVRRNWEACTRRSWHPVTLWPKDGFELDHGIGASLSCGPGVSTLVAAPWAFSDRGHPDNAMGSFLGNYRYEAGERLGDLALIAWRTVGRGKLVVYGDTSAFQNGSLPSGYARHVLPLLVWLSKPVRWHETAPARAALALVLLLLAALAATASMAPAWLCVGLALALTATATIGRELAPRPAVTGKDVLVDMSCHPWVGHYDAQMNPTMPLFRFLARGGLRALEVHGLEPAALAAARAVVLVAPSRRLPAAEVERMLEYMESGGVVLLCAGSEQQAAAEPLLHALGLDVLGVPLGTVPAADQAGAERLLPRLLDAWPLGPWPAERGWPQGTRTLFAWGEHRLAVHVPRGRGGAIVIGDARFFSCRNLEDTWGHWPGNAKLLYHLLGEYLGAAPDAVRPEFVSPKKPD